MDTKPSISLHAEILRAQLAARNRNAPARASLRFLRQSLSRWVIPSALIISYSTRSLQVLGSQPCPSVHTLFNHEVLNHGPNKSGLKRDKKPSKIIDAQRTASLILVASTGAIAFQASRVTTATEERTRSAPKVASTSFKYAFSAIFPFNARPDLFRSAPGSLEASSIVHTLSSSSNPRLGAMDLSSLGRQFSHIRHILALLSSLSYVKHPLL
jgi:hypothetical protein